MSSGTGRNGAGVSSGTSAGPRTCCINAPRVQVQPRLQAVEERGDKADVVRVVICSVAALAGLCASAGWRREGEASTATARRRGAPGLPAAAPPTGVPGEQLAGQGPSAVGVARDKALELGQLVHAAVGPKGLPVAAP